MTLRARTLVFAARASSLFGCRSDARGDPPGASSAVLPPVIGSVTVDEVRPLLPKASDLAGARVVTDVTRGAGGRVGVELCVPSSTPEQAWKSLQPRLTALGWGEPFSQRRERGVLLSARRAPFTLTGEIVQDLEPPKPGVPPCDGRQGESLVILRVHRAT